MSFYSYPPFLSLTRRHGGLLAAGFVPFSRVDRKPGEEEEESESRQRIVFQSRTKSCLLTARFACLARGSKPSEEEEEKNDLFALIIITA